MKEAYPILISPAEGGFVVYIPDFNINTEGDTLTDALEMAKDAIGIIGIEMEDRKQALPTPSEVKAVIKETEILLSPLIRPKSTILHAKNFNFPFTYSCKKLCSFNIFTLFIKSI